jgi:hypothetical protein
VLFEERDVIGALRERGELSARHATPNKMWPLVGESAPGLGLESRSARVSIVEGRLCPEDHRRVNRDALTANDELTSRLGWQLVPS